MLTSANTGAPTVPEGGSESELTRKSPVKMEKHRVAKAPGSSVYHLVLGISILVLGGSAVTPPGPEKIQCFTCMDEEQCSKLSVIYGKNDMKLYERDGQEFPECSAISSPPPVNCSACHVQTNISIICSGEVGKLEVESREGAQISDISSGCSFKFPVENQHPRSCVGLITSNFFLTVLGVLLTWSNIMILCLSD